jgi:hypothetical protein
MSRKLGILAGLLVLLTAAKCGTVWGADPRGDYCPVVFSYAWDSEVSVWLIGGFKDGQWYRHTDLPIMVDGRAITPEEGMELNESADCSTPLLQKGENLAFYSADGKKVGVRTVKGTKYSCSAASWESFIDVEIDALELPAFTMTIGVREGWNAVPAPTRRAAEGGNIVFVLESDEKPEKNPIVTFSPDVDEYEEKIYRGALAVGGTSCLLTDAYVEAEDQLDGFFIDLNGDGRTEFVLHASGIAGFVSAYEWDLENGGEATAILSLDLGD